MPTDPFVRSEKVRCPCTRSDPHYVRRETVREHLKGPFLRRRLRARSVLLDVLNVDQWPDAESMQERLRTVKSQLQHEQVTGYDFATLPEELEVEEADVIDLINNTERAVDNGQEQSCSYEDGEADKETVMDLGENKEEDIEEEGLSEDSEGHADDQLLETQTDATGFRPIGYYDKTPIEVYRRQHDKFTLDSITSCSLANLIAQINNGGSQNLLSEYTRNFNQLLRRDYNNSGLLSHARIVKRLKDWTHLYHIRIGCCINSCCAFTGQWADLDVCPYCDETRFAVQANSTRTERATFDLTSIIKRLRTMFAGPPKSAELQRTDKESRDGTVSDIWDGAFIRKLKMEGFFNDNRDVALGISTDGIQLFKIGDFEVWPILLTNYSLAKTLRYNSENQIILGVIPGPTQPKDMNSFVLPIVDELKLLEDGVPAWDGYQMNDFTLRAHPIILQADSPGMSKLINLSGHQSYFFCSHCTQLGVHHSNAMRCPHLAPTDLSNQSGQQTFTHTDVTQLPMRTHGQWIANAQYMELLPKDSEAERDREIRKCNGIKGFSPFLVLKTIRAPYSFVVDGMHVLLCNIQPLILECWAGTELSKPGKKSRSKKKKKSDASVNTAEEVPIGDTPGKEAAPGAKFAAFDNNNLYHISYQQWKDISMDQIKSVQSMHPSVGVSLKPVNTHHKRYTASMRLQWIFQSPILLKNRLHEEAYKSWCDFVRIVQALLKPYARSSLSRLRLALAKFVLDFERLYYQRKANRLHVCRSQIHSLLHLADTLEMFGPISITWQFPMERVAGILKSKTHNRSLANRNISIASLYCEQINLIDLVCIRGTSLQKQAGTYATYDSKRFPGLGLEGFHLDQTLEKEELTQLAELYAGKYQQHYATIRRSMGNVVVGVYKRGWCQSDQEYIGRFKMGSALNCSRHHSLRNKDNSWARVTKIDRTGVKNETIAKVQHHSRACRTISSVYIFR